MALRLSFPSSSGVTPTPKCLRWHCMTTDLGWFGRSKYRHIFARLMFARLVGPDFKVCDQRFRGPSSQAMKGSFRANAWHVQGVIKQQHRLNPRLTCVLQAMPRLRIRRADTVTGKLSGWIAIEIDRSRSGLSEDHLIFLQCQPRCFKELTLPTLVSEGLPVPSPRSSAPAEADFWCEEAVRWSEPAGSATWAMTRTRDICGLPWMLGSKASYPPEVWIRACF